MQRRPARRQHGPAAGADLKLRLNHRDTEALRATLYLVRFCQQPADFDGIDKAAVRLCLPPDIIPRELIEPDPSRLKDQSRHSEYSIEDQGLGRPAEPPAALSASVSRWLTCSSYFSRASITARMVAMGAGLLVHASNCAAAWRTNISTPLMVCAPADSACPSSLVFIGL